MLIVRHERTSDVAAREELLDIAFGAERRAKTSERLREGRLPADGLSFVASEGGRLIGTARLWNITAGPRRPALLLGPLAVASDRRNRGIGSALMRRALRDARRLGHRLILLVGDAPFYGRFGFASERTGALWLPGPFERARLLAHELVPGALTGAHGLMSATGRPQPRPGLAALIARADRTTTEPARAA